MQSIRYPGRRMRAGITPYVETFPQTITTERHRYATALQQWIGEQFFSIVTDLVGTPQN